jgi:hypothetical protein
MKRAKLAADPDPLICIRMHAYESALETNV